MDQYEFVRTAHKTYGKNISELSRLTGHSRNTIKIVGPELCLRLPSDSGSPRTPLPFG